MFTDKTEYCQCPTDRRPKADETGHCPKCELLRAPKAPNPTKRQRKPTKAAWERNADHIDGYDRDDLGLSPDYDPRDD